MSRIYCFLLKTLLLTLAIGLMAAPVALAAQPPGANLVSIVYSEKYGLLVLSRYELFHSTDGKTWQAAGLAGRGQAYTALGEGGATILVAAESGKLFRSVDGKEFSAVDAPRDPYGRTVTAIRSLALNSKGEEVLASSGQGVIRSRDGGLTWQPVTEPFWKDSEARQVLLVGFAKNSPVIITRNGAWREAKAGFEPFNKGLPDKIQPTTAAFSESEILMALPEKGIFLAVKDSSWKALKGAPGDPVAFVGFRKKGYLAARVASPLNTGDDKGAKWTPVGNFSPNFAPRNSAFAPFGDFVTLRGKGLYRIEGESLLAVPLPADLSNVNAYLELSSGYIAGTQGGVYHSSDGGSSWADVTPPELGAPVNLFLKTSSMVLLGAEGAGVFASDDGGMSWRAWDRGLGTANTIRGLTEYEGGILAATENGLMWTAIGAEPEWGFRSGGIGRESIMGMARDGEVVWLATLAGLYRSEGKGDFEKVPGYEGRVSTVDAQGGRVIALVDGRILMGEGKARPQAAANLPEMARPSAVAFFKGVPFAGSDRGLFALEGQSWKRSSDAVLPVAGLYLQKDGLRVVTGGGGSHLLR